MASSAVASVLADASGPSGSGDYPHDNRQSPSGIVSFNEAISALRQHTFKNINDFQGACRAARDIHYDTFMTINSADISNLQAARDQLHHSDDYLAYISTLHASLAAVEPDSPLLGRLIAEYEKLVADTPREWARAVPDRWVGVSRHAARLAIERHDIQLALSLVKPLREAAAKLAPGLDFLVPIQADLLAVCLEARCYKLAASWIRSHRRLQVDVADTALTGTDVHLIHHYSAMIYIGVKDFRAALQCCRLALAVPSPSPGPFYDVAVSTFKLFILLHLLVTGKSPSPLKFSSYQAPRLRKTASEYMELAYAYDKRDLIQLRQVFQSNRDLFEKQGNIGLVKQVVNSLSKELIIRLTNSFVTMTMEDLANRAGLANEAEAQAMIVEMIRSNKINASIDDRKGVVRLMENDMADEESISRNLSSGYMNDCVNIVQRIEAFRESMEVDPNYIIKEWSHRGRRGPSRGAFGGGNSRLDGFEAEFMR